MFKKPEPLKRGSGFFAMIAVRVDTVVIVHSLRQGATSHNEFVCAKFNASPLPGQVTRPANRPAQRPVGA